MKDDSPYQLLYVFRGLLVYVLFQGEDGRETSQSRANLQMSVCPNYKVLAYAYSRAISGQVDPKLPKDNH